MDKFILGELNKEKTKGQGIPIIFKASREKATDIKGRWIGSVNFYFNRK